MDLVLKNNIYDTRKHIISMLKYRGFDTSKIKDLGKDELGLLLEKHKTAGFEHANNLSLLDIMLKNEETGKKIVIKYKLDNKMPSNVKKLTTQINEIYENYELTKKDCLILLYNDFINLRDDKSKKMIKYVNNLWLNNKFVQVYGLMNFKFNISEHIFVPHHEIIYDKTKIKSILDSYFTTIDKLPKIKREDPMAKYIGARPGDLVYIKGLNETVGLIDKYRVCEEQ